MTAAPLAALLAHQGGWDEMLLVAGPMALITVLLLLADRRAKRALTAETADEEAGDGEAADGAAPPGGAPAPGGGGAGPAARSGPNAGEHRPGPTS